MRKFIRFTAIFGGVILLLYALFIIFAVISEVGQYWSKIYDVSIPIESNLYVISEAEYEIKNSTKYTDGMRLEYVQYVFASDGNTVEFNYYKFDEKRGYATTLTIDLDQKKIVSISYAKGKLVSVAHTGPLGDNSKINVKDVYDKCLSDKKYQELFNDKAHELSITVTKDKIFKKAFDKETYNSYRFDD